MQCALRFIYHFQILLIYTLDSFSSKRKHNFIRDKDFYNSMEYVEEQVKEINVITILALLLALLLYNMMNSALKLEDLVLEG